MRKFVLFVPMVLFIAIATPVLAQNYPVAPPPRPPDANSANADVLKLVAAGMPENIVLEKIHSTLGKFDTSAAALVALKKAGATDAELNAIMASANGGAPPSTSTPIAPPPAQPAPSTPTAAFPSSVKASGQTSATDWQTGAPALVAALNAQQEKIPPYGPHHVRADFLKAQVSTSENPCQLHVKMLDGIIEDMRANPLNWSSIQHATIEEGVLDFSHIDPLSIQAGHHEQDNFSVENGTAQYGIVEMYGSHDRVIFSGDVVNIDDIHKAEPMALPVACSNNGRFQNGSKCTISPSTLKKYSFVIPDGVDAAQSIADQMISLAKACNVQ